MRQVAVGSSVGSRRARRAPARILTGIDWTDVGGTGRAGGRAGGRAAAGAACGASCVADLLSRSLTRSLSRSVAVTASAGAGAGAGGHRGGHSPLRQTTNRPQPRSRTLPRVDVPAAQNCDRTFALPGHLPPKTNAPDVCPRLWLRFSVTGLGLRVRSIMPPHLGALSKVK